MTSRPPADADRAERSRSFGRVAADYHRFRPRTPPEMLDWLLPPPGDEPGASVVDLAAGTGALSETLVDRTHTLVAVEPDPGMRAILRRAVPGARIVAGVAEALPLRSAAVDAVLVSSAWHWFDGARAVPEIARVLRAGGRLGVVGSSFDPDVAWVNELRRPIVGEGTERPARPSAARPQLPPGDAFGPAETHEVRWQRDMTRAGLTGLLGTYSRVIVASEAVKAELQRTVAAVLDAEPATRGHDVVAVPMRTWATRFTRLG